MVRHVAARRGRDLEHHMQSSRLQQTILTLSHALLIRYRRSFYVWLAIILSALLVADLASTHLVRGMQNSTFDLLMRYRVHYPLPDRDILIVDIDDASLKILAGRLGRWPWSREVFTKVAGALNAQQPKAIVFDILFGEADTQNPAADAAFAELVARSRALLVPMVLLDEIATSPTAGALVPSAVQVQTAEPHQDKITVALPYFYRDLAPAQLGTDNAHPDQDGTIRHFYPWQTQHGWKLPSMPVQVLQTLGLATPAMESFVVNWRGPAYSYRFVSFSTVLDMVERGDDRRLRKQFAGKIILIGSTATSLFDLRTTPVAKIHPGVEIMATAIDNLKNDDYLREQPRWFIAFVSVVFMGLLAWSFHAQRHASIFDTAFVALQLGLVAVSYLTLNATNVYLDMTIPITAGLVYFSIARLHAVFAQKAFANQSRYFFLPQPDEPVCIGIMAARPDDGINARGFSSALDSAVAESALGVSRLGGLFEVSALVGAAFEGAALLCWVVPVALESAMLADAGRIRTRVGLSEGFTLHAKSAAWRASQSIDEVTRELICCALRDMAIARPL